MATTIVTKNGTGAPTDSDLVAGELAVDLTNGRLYTTDLDTGGTVIEIGLNPSGNVDVTGTVTADGLTVDGSTTFTGNTSPASDEVLLNLSSLNGTGTAGNMLRFTDLDPTATNNGSIGKIQFYSDDTDAVVVEIEGQNADASPDGRLIFKTAEGTTLRNRINIENNGDISFYEDTGTTAKFFWDASAESLGIGTTSPSEVLNVKTSSGNSYVDVERATQAQGEVGLKISGGTSGADWFVYQPASSNDLRFYKTGDKVTIDSSGNVGIGTSSPSATLEVDGVTNSTYLIVGGDDSSNGRALTFTSSASAAFNGAVHTINAPSSQGVIALSTGSTERMRIDASGNLLVGTTSTSIPNQSSNTGIFLFGGGSINAARSGAECAIFNRLTSDGEIVRIQKDGTTVGSIGTALGSAYLSGNGAGAIYINGSTDVRPWNSSTQGNYDNQIDLGASNARWKDLYLSGTANAGSVLKVNSAVDGTEAAPHFTILGAASSYQLNMWLDATAAYMGQNSALRSLRLYSSAETAGVQLSAGGTSWGTFSDERLKENVEPVENALQSLSGLRTVKYHLKDVDGPEDKKKIGVIAQDLVGVLDEVIDPAFRSDDDTEYMGVRYTELVPVLIKAIQEQQDLIESLTARIAALES